MKNGKKLKNAASIFKIKSLEECLLKHGIIKKIEN